MLNEADTCRTLITPQLQSARPGVLKAAAPKRRFGAPRKRTVPPISQHGNVNEIIGKFGGADQLRNTVNQLQSLLYAA